MKIKPVEMPDGTTHLNACWRLQLANFNEAGRHGRLELPAYKDAAAFAAGKAPLPGVAKSYDVTDPADFLKVASQSVGRLLCRTRGWGDPLAADGVVSGTVAQDGSGRWVDSRVVDQQALFVATVSSLTARGYPQAEAEFLAQWPAMFVTSEAGYAWAEWVKDTEGESFFEGCEDV